MKLKKQKLEVRKPRALSDLRLLQAVTRFTKPVLRDVSLLKGFPLSRGATL